MQRKEDAMRRLNSLGVCALGLALVAGCSSFGGGTATGAAAAGAGYEINAAYQMKELDKDYKAGKITQAEYEARKSQIQKGSIIQGKF